MAPFSPYIEVTGKTCTKNQGGKHMSIYEFVKANVTVPQAAEHYGVEVQRNGMCRCPFHDDRHPSMKLNKESQPIGKWEQMYRGYLKEHHPTCYHTR